MAKIKTYVHVRDLNENEKCAPQAKIILQVIKAAGEAGIERKALIETLGSMVGTTLTTTQGVDRIFGFYRKPLLASGVISEVVTEVEKPKAEESAEGAEAPAKKKRAPKPKPEAPPAKVAPPVEQA